MQVLTIVVPVFNEQDTIERFYEETEKYITEMPVKTEYLFVDDGSSDQTLDVLGRLHEKDPKVGYLSFSRNFGKESAIYAGLENARGDIVVVMDVDLQDPPFMLPQMYEALTTEGYDCVGTRRANRKGEPVIRSFFARQFYKLMKKISNAEVVDGARDYQMMKRHVVDAILSMPERNRFSKGIFGWIGFRKKWLEYENVERVAGETKWSFWKLFLYAIEGIVAFSTVPLIMASVFGLICCFAALIMIGVIIIRTLVFGDPTSGWPSLVCIFLLISGIQFFTTGILGQYLARTYIETKHRPIYLLKEKVIEESGKDNEEDNN